MDKATGVIVVPNWPTQIWFSKLTRLLIAEPILLPTGKKILHLPSDPKVVHPLYKKLNILICLENTGFSSKAQELIVGA
jgi:hypothetical protein